MCSDASDSSDSDDDREQARLRLLKKKRHRMDGRAKSIREKEPKRALRGPRMKDAAAVDSSARKEASSIPIACSSGSFDCENAAHGEASAI